MNQPDDIEYCLKIAVGLIASPIPPRFKNKPISLANYDVSFVNNAVRSINNGDGLSDRQRELSTKLVKKYVRQFGKLGIDVANLVETPVFSSPLRQVNRTRLLSLNDNSIIIRFPYNKTMINEFKSLTKKLRALTSEWNKENKQYEVDYNEYNLMQVYRWGLRHKFDYSKDLGLLVNQCKAIENNRHKYAIQLVVKDDLNSLHNAPSSLQQWWDSNMLNESTIRQIRTAADQNIDVVNKSTTLNLSALSLRMLNTRGGSFTYDECTLTELVKAAKELELNRVAFIVDGRHIAHELEEQIANTISEVGNEKSTVMLKYQRKTYEAKRRLTTDTEFAILDSASRFNHPKSNTDNWVPDVVISTQGFTKFQNVQAKAITKYKPWVCYYTDFNFTIERE